MGSLPARHPSWEKNWETKVLARRRQYRQQWGERGKPKERDIELSTKKISEGEK